MKSAFLIGMELLHYDEHIEQELCKGFSLGTLFFQPSFPGSGLGIASLCSVWFNNVQTLKDAPKVSVCDTLCNPLKET